MRKVIFYFLVLLFAVWLGIIMQHNPGYILVSYDNITIETSLWFTATALIVLFILFYWVLRIGANASFIASNFIRWVNNRRERRARAQTILGLYEYIEGKYANSEKRLSRNASHSDMPLINYLTAAFAAKHQHALKRSGNYLHLAQTVAGDRPVAMGLAQAKIQISNKQMQKACITLQRLHSDHPKNPLILRLLQEVYLELKDWYGLEKILPLLRKRRALTAEELSWLEEKVYSELLLIGAETNNIKNVWIGLPRHLHKNPVVAKVYTEYLLANNEVEHAEGILKMILRKNLDGRLLDLYSTMQSSNPIKHLVRAEEWFKDNPENPDLLLSLGRICRLQKLWGKARDYLEKSAQLNPSLETYVELAQLMQDQNISQKALNYYRKGLQLR